MVKRRLVAISATRTAGFARAFLVIFILALGFRVAAHGIAAFYGVASPKQALEWDSGSPAPQLALAAEQIKNGDALHAQYALNSLAVLLVRDPLTPGALSLFGLAVSISGQPSRAKMIMSIAARQNPSDIVAHSWLYDEAIGSGDVRSAFVHLDFLLRARPTLVDTVGPSIVSFIERNFSAQEMIESLIEKNPPWRQLLLRYMCQNIKNVSIVFNLFGRLNSSKTVPTRDEWSFLIARLILDRDFEGAYFAWQASLPVDRQEVFDLLYNSGFQYAITNLPFDWQIIPSNGATVKVDQPAQNGELQVEFFGARVPFHNVRHMLFLRPGAYQFSGSQKADGFESERGVQWQVSCLNKNVTRLGSTQPLTRSQAYQAFSISFEVPAKDCIAQELVLLIPARVPDEMIAYGTVSYTGLSIRKN